MAQQTQPRVAIRAALRAAGIITEHGRVAGAWLEVPDAPLFALIEEHELHWSLFLALYSQKGKKKPDRDQMHEHWKAARRAKDALAAMSATTLPGAHAKATFALDMLTSGAKSDGGCLARLLVSALRDVLRGPVASPAPEGGNVVRIADRRADAVLIGKLEELETARAIGRPHDPLGVEHPDLLPPTQLAALRRFMTLEEEIAGIPAQTATGITAKLQATTSRGTCPDRVIGASAARDFLRLWEAWA